MFCPKVNSYSNVNNNITNRFDNIFTHTMKCDSHSFNIKLHGVSTFTFKIHLNYWMSAIASLSYFNR